MRTFKGHALMALPVSLLAGSSFAVAAALGSQCPPSLPNPLPFNESVVANACSMQGNTPCNATTYDSPISTSTFTLDAPSTVIVSLDGLNAPGFDPTFYLSGGICDVIQCDGTAPLPDLPAGSYCMTVTASPFDSVGACGCFTMYVSAALPDRLFDDGFEVVTARVVVDI